MKEYVLSHMRGAMAINFIGTAVFAFMFGQPLVMLMFLMTVGMYVDLEKRLNKFSA